MMISDGVYASRDVECMPNKIKARGMPRAFILFFYVLTDILYCGIGIRYGAIRNV